MQTNPVQLPEALFPVQGLTTNSHGSPSPSLNQPVDFTVLFMNLLGGSDTTKPDQLGSNLLADITDDNLLPDSGNSLPHLPDVSDQGKVLPQVLVPHGLIAADTSSPEDENTAALLSFRPEQSLASQSLSQAVRQFLQNQTGNLDPGSKTENTDSKGLQTQSFIQAETNWQGHMSGTSDNVQKPGSDDSLSIQSIQKLVDNPLLLTDTMPRLDTLKQYPVHDIVQASTSGHSGKTDALPQQLISHTPLSSPLPDSHQDSISAQKTLDIRAPITSPEWADEVSSKIRWITNNDLQSAEIRLHPKHLGVIEVKVNISNDQANIHFVTPNAQVRDALETAAHRLRDMLDVNGLQLSNFGVSDHSLSGGNNRNDQAQGYQNYNYDLSYTDSNGENPVVYESPLHVASGLVDYYA